MCSLYADAEVISFCVCLENNVEIFAQNVFIGPIVFRKVIPANCLSKNAPRTRRRTFPKLSQNAFLFLFEIPVRLMVK